MSSRDRRNRAERPEREPRVSSSNFRDDRGSSSDEEFDEFDVDDPDAETSFDETSSYSSRGDKGTRRSSLGGGTAEQIDRLRRSMAQGSTRRSPSTPRQSLGRNYLARPEPEPVSPSYGDDSDDDLGQVADPYTDEPVHRSGIQRSDDVLRQDPFVTRSDARYASRDVSPYQDDDDPYYDDDDDFDDYDAPRGASWQRSPFRSGPQGRPLTRPSLPPAITQADLMNDAAALSIIGIGILSLAAMAIVVANKADSLAPSFATHVSASGVLEHFASSNGLWRLPLLSAMLTLMNIVAAWFISPLDRFASRFLLAAAVVVQILAWVALIRIL